MVDGQPEEFINIDGAVMLLKSSDTPEARTLYRAYRKEVTRLRRKAPELTVEKRREAALFAVLPTYELDASRVTKPRIRVKAISRPITA